MPFKLILQHLMQHVPQNELSSLFKPLLSNNLKKQAIFVLYQQLLQDNKIQKLKITSPELSLIFQFSYEQINFIQTEFQQFSITQLQVFLTNYYESGLVSKKLNEFLLNKVENTICLPSYIIFLTKCKTNQYYLECILKNSHIIQSMEIWNRINQSISKRTYQSVVKMAIVSDLCFQNLLNQFFSLQSNNYLLNVILKISHERINKKDIILKQITQCQKMDQYYIFLLKLSYYIENYDDIFINAVQNISNCPYDYYTYKIAILFNILNICPKIFYEEEFENIVFKLYQNCSNQFHDQLLKTISKIEEQKITLAHKQILMDCLIKYNETNQLTVITLLEIFIAKFHQCSEILQLILDNVLVVCQYSQQFLLKYITYMFIVNQQLLSSKLDQVFNIINTILSTYTNQNLIYQLFLLVSVICHYFHENSYLFVKIFKNITSSKLYDYYLLGEIMVISIVFNIMPEIQISLTIEQDLLSLSSDSFTTNNYNFSQIKNVLSCVNDLQQQQLIEHIKCQTLYLFTNQLTKQTSCMLQRQLIQYNFFVDNEFLTNYILKCNQISSQLIIFMYEKQLFHSIQFAIQNLKLSQQNIDYLNPPNTSFQQSFVFNQDLQTIFTYVVFNYSESQIFSFTIKEQQEVEQIIVIEFFNKTQLQITIDSLQEKLYLNNTIPQNLLELQFVTSNSQSSLNILYNNSQIFKTQLLEEPQLLDAKIYNQQYYNQKFQEKDAFCIQSQNLAQRKNAYIFQNYEEQVYLSNLVYNVFNDLLNNKYVNDQNFLELTYQIYQQQIQHNKIKYYYTQSFQLRPDLQQFLFMQLQHIVDSKPQIYSLKSQNLKFLCQLIFSSVNKNLTTQDLYVMLQASVLYNQLFDNNVYIFQVSILLLQLEQINTDIQNFIVVQKIYSIFSSDQLFKLLIFNEKQNVQLTKQIIHTYNELQLLKFSVQQQSTLFYYYLQERNQSIYEQYIIFIKNNLLFSELLFDVQSQYSELQQYVQFFNLEQFESKYQPLINVFGNFLFANIFVLSFNINSNDIFDIIKNLLTKLVQDNFQIILENKHLSLIILYQILQYNTKEISVVDLIITIIQNDIKLLLTFFKNDQCTIIMILNRYKEKQVVIDEDLALDCSIILYQLKYTEQNLWLYFITKKMCLIQLILYQKISLTKFDNVIEKIQNDIFNFNSKEQEFLRSIVNGDQVSQNENLRENFLAQILYCMNNTEITLKLKDKLTNIIGDFQLQFVYKYIYEEVDQLLDLFADKLHVAMYMMDNIQKVAFLNQSVQICHHSKCCNKKNDSYFQTCYNFCPICNKNEKQVCLYIRDLQFGSAYMLDQVTFQDKKIYPSKRFLLKPIMNITISSNLQNYDKSLLKQTQFITQALRMQVLGNKIMDIFVNEKQCILKENTQTVSNLQKLLEVTYQRDSNENIDNNQLDEYERNIKQGMFNLDIDKFVKQSIIQLKQIRLIFVKQIANYFPMIEIILFNSKSFILVFNSQADFVSFSTNQFIQSVFESKLVNLQVQMKNIIKLYKSQEMSIFSFILSLNYLSGRSYEDLYQYPIFPLIQEKRDLSLSIGEQSPEIVQKLLQKQLEFKDSNSEAMSLFQTFYSHRAIAQHFLFKIDPFTSIQRQLQNGVYDCYDRQFHSISEQFQKVLNGKSLSELVPELFTTFEFLCNLNNLDYNETGIFNPEELESNENQFLKVLELRSLLENTPSITAWISLIFGGQIPDGTYPQFCRQQQYDSFDKPEVLKTLFYGVEPVQIFTKNFIPDRKLKGFELKETISNGVIQGCVQPELPLPYVFTRTFPVFSEHEIYDSKQLICTKNDVQVYEITKKETKNTIYKIVEKELLYEFNSELSIDRAEFLSSDELIFSCQGQIFLYCQHSSQNLFLDYPVEYLLQKQSNRIVAVYENQISIFQVKKQLRKLYFEVQIPSFDQIICLNDDQSGGFSIVFSIEKLKYFEYFNSSGIRIIQKKIRKDTIFANFVYQFDQSKWIGVISANEFQIFDFNGVEKFQVNGEFTKFQQLSGREVLVVKKDGGAVIVGV